MGGLQIVTYKGTCEDRLADRLLDLNRGFDWLRGPYYQILWTISTHSHYRLGFRDQSRGGKQSQPPYPCIPVTSMLVTDVRDEMCW